MRKFHQLLSLLLLVLFGSNLLFAQATASGSIQGTVYDKSQAIVVGAQVTATNQATGASRTSTSSDSGGFRFDLLPAGKYTVRVSKSGFATLAQNVELLVGQTASANAILTPGSASEVMEVTDIAPLVDVSKTSVSQDITPREVEEMPLLGRDVANLAYLAPGVKSADSYDPTKNRYAILSVNGQSGRNVNVTVNGVDNKDNTVGGTVMQLPLEAVEEFQISTQRFSAANGKSEGAAINMITKSGTNHYHGSAFGFFRDQSLNAIDYFAAKNGEKSPYSRQQFGGSIGGPLIKDKTFGFFAYERQREHTSLSESPDALAELNLATSIGANPASVIPTPFFETRYNGRLDHHFNNHHSGYLSYTSQANNSNNDQSDGNGDLTGGNFTTNHLQIANATLNSVLTNSLVNSFTAGFQYWNNVINSDNRLPYVTFGSGAWFGTNTNVPQQSFQRKFQFRDDITKTQGNHTLKAGVDYVWTPILGGYFESNSTLEIDFTDDPSQILNDPVKYPQGFASPGAVGSMSVSAGDPHFVLDVKQLGLYFQDDWKATRRLSLNLGVRYDRDFNLLGASAIRNSRTYQELQAIGSPFAASLPHDDTKDFSPRIGFAYDLTGTGKHVIRGGFGLYYGNVFENIPLFMIQQANSTIYQGVFSITRDSGATVPGTGILLSDWRYGVDPLPAIPPPLTELTDGSTGRLIDPKYQNPYTEQFNVGYQWAPNNNTVIEAEYIHVLGLHEEKTINTNPIDPATGARPLDAAFASAGVPVLGRISTEMSINRSRYDGLNLSYRRRMSRHFSVNTNYTLSRSLGFANESGAPLAPAGFRNYPHDPRKPLDPLDYGPTPEDERHHITFSGIVELPWGFQVSPIVQFGTSRPYDLNQGYDVLGIGSGYSRPVIVPISDPTNYTVFKVDKNDPTKSTSALAGGLARACLAAGQCRQAGYDTVRGDAFFQFDARIAKNIKLGESRNLQLIFQGFNLTNRTNFGNNFTNTVSSAKFMQPNGYINPSSSTQPRAFVGEFGARFTF